MHTEGEGDVEALHDWLGVAPGTYEEEWRKARLRREAGREKKKERERDKRRGVKEGRRGMCM